MYGRILRRVWSLIRFFQFVADQTHELHLRDKELGLNDRIRLLESTVADQKDREKDLLKEVCCIKVFATLWAASAVHLRIVLGLIHVFDFVLCKGQETTR